MFESLMFAAGVTLIIGFVAYHYFSEGKKRGIEEVMAIVYELEPKAFKRIHVKLKKELDAR